MNRSSDGSSYCIRLQATLARARSKTHVQKRRHQLIPRPTLLDLGVNVFGHHLYDVAAQRRDLVAEREQTELHRYEKLLQQLGGQTAHFVRMDLADKGDHFEVSEISNFQRLIFMPSIPQES